MIIQLERSGGFAGMVLHAQVDTEALDPQEKASLESMVEAANFFSLPEKIMPAGPGADRFSYRITIQKSGASRIVEVSESGVPETLQPLIQRILFLKRTSQNR